MMYLLDTDTVSCALRGEGNVNESILARSPAELALSSISVAELRFGAERRGSKKLYRLIDTFCRELTVLPFDLEAAIRFGMVSARLEQAGTPIGLADTLIAAHALAAGRVLVTNNRRHFERVRGLRVESWR